MFASPGSVHFLFVYGMFPVRLLAMFMGLLMSLIVVALGKPWREEWSDLNLRGYLFEGRNWNSWGF